MSAAPSELHAIHPIIFAHHYRPQNRIEDCIVHAAAAQQLAQIWKHDATAHLLLCGGTGCGKTTLADVLAAHADPPLPIWRMRAVADRRAHALRNDLTTFCQSIHAPAVSSSSTTSAEHGVASTPCSRIVVLDDVDLYSDVDQLTIASLLDRFGSRGTRFICTCTALASVQHNLCARMRVHAIPLPTENDMLQLLHLVCADQHMQAPNPVDRQIVRAAQHRPGALLNHLQKCALQFAPHEPRVLQEEHVDFADIPTQVMRVYVQQVLARNATPAIQIILGVAEQGVPVIDILSALFEFVLVHDELSPDQRAIFIPGIAKYMRIFFDVHEEEFELAMMTDELVHACLEQDVSRACSRSAARPRK